MASARSTLAAVAAGTLRGMKQKPALGEAFGSKVVSAMAGELVASAGEGNLLQITQSAFRLNSSGQLYINDLLVT